MRELSPALQQLVEAGKRADRPTIADRERVYRAVNVRLGLAMGVAGAAPHATVLEDLLTAPTLRTAAKTTAGLALVGAGFALVHWLAAGMITYPDAALAISAARTVSPSNAVAATEPNQQRDVAKDDSETAPDQIQIAPAAVPPVAPAAPAAARVAVRPRDSLSEEVDILSRAEKELHSGHPEKALSLLNEHERKFKNGSLAEERTAARVQSLCALGRTKEADALFGRLSPQSLHGEPTHQVCVTAMNASSRR